MEQLPVEQLGEKKEQLPPRNLLTHPEETIQAMAEIEGPEWLNQQKRVEETLKNTGEYENNLINALERLKIGKKSIIYGRGGGNRWHVAANGEVSFSEALAESPNYLQKARNLGFKILP